MRPFIPNVNTIKSFFICDLLFLMLIHGKNELLNISTGNQFPQRPQN